MATVSPAGAAPGPSLLQAPSRGGGPAARLRAGVAKLEVDWAFLRSQRGVLKIARTLMALMALICFTASGAHEAYTALTGMETVINGLFLLLYLLRLDARMRCLFWPLVDVVNSVVAALFLLAVGLLGVPVQSNKGTLVGRVFGLLLLTLCLIDAVVVCKKISIDKERGRNASAN